MRKGFPGAGRRQLGAFPGSCARAPTVNWPGGAPVPPATRGQARYRGLQTGSPLKPQSRIPRERRAAQGPAHGLCNPGGGGVWHTGVAKCPLRGEGATGPLRRARRCSLGAPRLLGPTGFLLAPLGLPPRCARVATGRQTRRRGPGCRNGAGRGGGGRRVQDRAEEWRGGGLGPGGRLPGQGWGRGPGAGPGVSPAACPRGSRVLPRALAASLREAGRKLCPIPELRSASSRRAPQAARPPRASVGTGFRAAARPGAPRALGAPGPRAVAGRAGLCDVRRPAASRAG